MPAKISTNMPDRQRGRYTAVSYTHLDVYKRQALCPEDGTDYGTLFKAADGAMYQAKEQSRNQKKSGAAEE